MTQIRNFLRKWYQNQGSIVLKLTSPKTKIAKFANQNDKGSLQQTHSRSSTSSRKVWCLDNGWSQDPQRGGVNHESVTGTLSWYKILPLNGFNLIRAQQRLHRRRKRVCESFSSRHTSQKLFLPFNTSSIRDKLHCWKSGTQKQGRNFCNIVAIRIGCKVVGWFYGMLLLSAKCPRLPGRWENSPWKRVSDVNTRSIKLSSFWQESFTRNLSWVRIDRGEIWKGDISIADLEEWERWTHQEFIFGESMRKKYWYHKTENNSYSQKQMVQQNCKEETTNSENPL